MYMYNVYNVYMIIKIIMPCITIFRHLKLEIALAIPASNDEKWSVWARSVS